ncbi:hypothetical protein RN001_005521 [Aquatica leii]|uniref:Uncharacterized protein n=1 Tax=Aquatica leii TaxID=1421715 RepID=A0AAN7Q1F0_9COLE|nr:hypothetical protein RN001_005521 [Aquatica leii]
MENLSKTQFIERNQSKQKCKKTNRLEKQNKIRHEKGLFLLQFGQQKIVLDQWQNTVLSRLLHAEVRALITNIEYHAIDNMLSVLLPHHQGQEKEAC